MASLGLLIVYRSDDDTAVSAQILHEEDFPQAMVAYLNAFAVYMGFSGVNVDEVGPVCTASVDFHGQTQVLWMAWVPGFDGVRLSDELATEDGYVHLLKGRIRVHFTEDDFIA